MLIFGKFFTGKIFNTFPLKKSSHRILFIFLPPIFLLIGKIYYEHVGGFSFGDEWNNFIAGYFMQKNKTLYGDIFYNHQMLMAYISFVIQKILRPENLYQLALYHRMFIVLFSLSMGSLLIYKFRFVGLFFVLFYELTKFYLFGHLFLAESMVVYVSVYLFGLAWQKIHKKKISFGDLLFSGIGTWFVLFSREPYIPLALFLYIVIVMGKLKREKYISIFSFVIFSLVSFIPILSAVPEFLFQNIIFNFTYIIPYEAATTGAWWQALLKALFYPFTIFFEGKWNHFRIIMIGLDVIFLISLFYSAFWLRKIKLALFVVCVLGLAGVRNVSPGTIYYEAFHLVVWYGLFITVILFLLSQFYIPKHKKTFYVCSALLFLVGVYTISPQSFVWEKVDKQALFTQNYAHYYINGEAIKVLSKPGDTLFTDMWDYLIYFQTGLDTDYKYSIYSFATSAEKKYSDARLEMFRTRPPDFYYTLCPKEVYESKLIPKDRVSEYVQLYRDQNPSCTYVHKSKIAFITPEQWVKAAELGFSLPK